jgi:hypothetical protein
MPQRSVVMTAALLEITAGAAFLTMPAVAARLLFAADLEGVGLTLAHFGGLGLFALGIACFPSREWDRAAVPC